MPSNERAPRATVVLVDDDEAIRTAFTAALRAEGFEVRAAADAVEGVQLVVRERPDAVVCDMRMPGRSGLAVIEAAGSLTERPAIIAFTAVPENSEIWDGRNLGWDRYVEKPSSPSELARVIEQAVARPAKRPAARERTSTAKSTRSGTTARARQDGSSRASSTPTKKPRKPG